MQRQVWLWSLAILFALFTTAGQAKGFNTAAEKAAGGFEYAGDWQRRSGWNVYEPYGKPPAGLDEPAVRRGDDALTAGGSWWYGPEQTTAEALQWKPADFYAVYAVYVGFRCAYGAD